MTLHRAPDFAHLPPPLRRIFDGAGQRSFFAQAGWYDLLARHAVGSETEIRLYADDHPDEGAVLALAETRQARGRSLASLANAYSVEHGLIAENAGEVAPAVDRIVAQLVGERPRWDRLTLSELAPEEPSYHLLARRFRGAGMVVECFFTSGTWYEETAGMSFRDYLADRSSQLRNTWQRKRKKLRQAGRFEAAYFDGPSGIDKAIADYETIYAASWKEPEFAAGLMPGLIRLAAEQNALRLGIYYLDGQPAAAQFWIVWAGRAVIYKLAHDQHFDEFSPGTLLTMDLAERVLEQDRPAEINFGRGDDPYKRLWLSRRRERWGMRVCNPWTARGLGFAVERTAAKAYHLIRGERLYPTPP